MVLFQVEKNVRARHITVKGRLFFAPSLSNTEAAQSNFTLANRSSIHSNV